MASAVPPLKYTSDEYNVVRKVVPGNLGDKYSSRGRLENILKVELSDMRAINGPGDMYYLLMQRKSTSNTEDYGYETEYVRRPPLQRDAYTW